jgi:ABC-type multidrug transport system fused ATPase/permease subunit
VGPLKRSGEFVWLLSRVKPYWLRTAAALFWTTLGGLAMTIDPLLMRRLIDVALPQRDLRAALLLVGGIGLCYFGRSAFYSLGALANFSVTQFCTFDLRLALLDQMNRLSADYHEQTPTGEKLTRLEYDVDQIAGLGADTVNQSVRAVLFFVLNLVMMAKLNVPMMLMVMPLLPLFVLVQRRYRPLIQERADKTRAEVGSASTILTEHLSAVPQIQLLGAEISSSKKAAGVWEGMLRAQWTQRRMEIGFSLSISAVMVSAILLVLGFGSAKVLGQSLTVGGLVAFYAYVTRVFEPLSSAMDLYARTQRVGASIRRVREILALQPTVADTGKIRFAAPALQQGFLLDDVVSGYGRLPVIHNLSFSIAAGEHVAVIGASGSGKSTLARLLVRFADPDQGRILLEGRPLAEYTLASLRNTVCYVPQQSVLFQGTMRENLLYGNRYVSAGDLTRVLRIAQLDEVLSKLPNGLDQELGPNATTLSGGERQRVAIARALLRRSAALVLDEATSALDAPTEHAVLEGIAALDLQHTLLVISHRISSLAWVDRFVILDKGRIVEVGRHADLYAHSQLYRSLYDASSQSVGLS